MHLIKVPYGPHTIEQPRWFLKAFYGLCSLGGFLQGTHLSGHPMTGHMVALVADSFHAVLREPLI